MRVTQQMKFSNLTRYLNENREALTEYRQRIVSGKRVTKASDGNVAFTTSRHLENSIRQNKQYQKNITNGLTKARFASDTLNSMIDVLIDFKGLTVRAASESVTDEEREILADQVEAMKKKLVNLGNAEFNDSYLFGGTKTNAAPFSIETTAIGDIVVKYAGNDEPLQTKISDISSVNISITGTDLRSMDAGGDLFKVFKNMENALRTDNTTAINSGIDAAEKALGHVTSIAAKLGININRMDHLKVKLKGDAIDMKGKVSQLVDTDFAKAFSMIQQYKATYKTALAVHAKIIQTSLLDFL